MITVEHAEAAIRREDKLDGPFPTFRVFYDTSSEEFSYSDRDTADEAAAEVADCDPRHGAYAELVSGPCWPLNCS